MTESSSDPLLQPYMLKHLRLKNRIMSTAHEPNYSEDGLPKDRYRLYHVEKAKGGIALTMTAGAAVVSEDSPPAFGNLLAYKDEIVPWMRRIADECHDHGTAVMIQLTHMGRRTNWNHSGWLPVIAPSLVREQAHRAFPKIAEDWDINRIVRDYAAAAQRMQNAGLDGIEITAYSQLFDSFLSPATNQRDDEYGGSLENRMRFSNRVLDAIRAAVGPDFIVGLRLVVDEDWNIGFSREEGIDIARRFVAGGKIDFINVIRGHLDTDAALTKIIPIYGMASSPHLEFAGEVRAQTKFPIFHAAKINDVATARHAIREGKLDMVGMTRAHIADPHIIRKIMNGREQDIRPCVGATYCLDRIYVGRDAVCVHNAATGREALMPHDISKSATRKKAVVIGAGPAGLEAARILGERGHDVVLLEATDKPGGQVRLFTRQKRRADFIGIIDWRIERCAAAGVRIRYNSWADPGSIHAEKPDVVIVATGGVPNVSPLTDGASLVTSTWDIISGSVALERNVLLYDDNSAHQGIQAAEYIAEAGSDLEFVTRDRTLAADIGGLNHVPYARALQQHDVKVTLNMKLESVHSRGNKLIARLGSDYTDKIWEREVDQVVVEHGTLPADDLYFDLKPFSVNYGEVDNSAMVRGKPQEISSNPEGLYQLFRIGDAVASRDIHAAIYDALRICKDI